MSKIHPKATLDLPSQTTSRDRMSAEREVFTVWMKSLIMNSKGCTVFHSSSGIVYRVDNYDCERSSEVYLMDRGGKVLFTILKKKYSLCKTWKGYGSTGSEERRTLFQVKEPLSFKKGESLYEVTVWTDKNQPSYFFIQGHGTSKSACNITKRLGGLMAEVKEKISSSGVLAGGRCLDDERGTKSRSFARRGTSRCLRTIQPQFVMQQNRLALIERGDQRLHRFWFTDTF